MDDPLAPLRQSTLQQAATKLDWAALHSNQVRDRLGDYVNEGAGFNLKELDGAYAIEVFAKPLPAAIYLSAETSIHALRSALDTAVSSLIGAARGDTTRTNFPMHESEEQLRADFCEGKNTCPDCGSERKTRPRQKQIIDHLPELESVLFDTIKPWLGGNDALWLISKLDNIQKHRSLMPILSFSTVNLDFATAEGNVAVGNDLRIYPNNIGILATSKEPIITGEKAIVRVDALIPDGMPGGGKPLVTQLVACNEAARDALIVIYTALKDQPAMQAR